MREFYYIGLHKEQIKDLNITKAEIYSKFNFQNMETSRCHEEMCVPGLVSFLTIESYLDEKVVHCV